jgi:nucleoside-diphosphate-sugar epimerase
MKVFVTGATGFTGSRTVPLLLAQGFEVRCLYRTDSDRSILPQPEIEWVLGDVANRQALSDSMKGAQALANIASLGFGHADSILGATRDAGIRRAVFISTTAIFTQLNARSKSMRLAAEDAIQKSDLDFTILRPTMIYGSKRDRNIFRLIRWLHTFPMFPIFGNGEYLQQPIFVDDVAQAIVSCLQNERTIRKSYNIAGRSPLSYNQVIDAIAAQMNKRIWKIHVPSAPVVSLMKFLEHIHVPLPIKSEQVLRLNENKNFDYVEAQKDFDFQPRSFAEGIKLELES